MLSKLLKYEIKATARIFLPLLAALLVFAGIDKLISLFSGQRWQAPEVISMTIYIILLVGTFIVAFVVMIQRFFKNLLSDEGYLMFTLPTKAWKHIASKLIVAMMWIIASGIAAILSILIITYDSMLTAEFMLGLNDFALEFFGLFGGGPSVLIILEALLACVISLASSILIIYASMALGHLFNRHRILASLGAFIVLNTVSQIIMSAVSASFIVPGLRFSAEINTLEDLNKVQPLFHSMMWYFIILFGLISAGYFVLTNYILSRKLNLE